MKLLIDIGNTHTGLVFEKQGRILKKCFFKTSREKISTAALKRLLGKNADTIKEILIVSVVPDFLSIVIKSLRTVLPGRKIKIIGQDIPVPIKIKYNKPRDVGQDRLIVSYAGFKLYSAPVLVIDFGTAVTFDIVNRKGEYEGGLIFPGVRLSLRSLTENAALLPHVELRHQSGIPGKSTRASINKGILYGYADLCDGLISRFKKKYGMDLKVIATGGDASLIAKNSLLIKRIKPDLLFEGLSLLS